ncbi:MAG: nucleotidyltransferase domain-containing protein [Candidatus Hydrogenedentota bacterium]
MPALDLEDRHLAMVRAILDAHVPGCEVWVYGSRATGTAKPYSDLDLVIVGEAPLSVRTLALLENAFEESDLPFRVDVADWASLPESFQAAIRTHAVPLPPAPAWRD